MAKTAEKQAKTLKQAFSAVGDSYYFQTIEGNRASDALSHATALLFGIKEVLQTEAELNGERGGLGISNTNYMLLSVIDSVAALIESADV